jgi:hypothetical protein
MIPDAREVRLRPKIRKVLEARCWVPNKHPNIHFHFTPTRSSWLNQVETRFSILQGQTLTGASFTSVEQLQEDIDAFIAAHNETAAIAASRSPGVQH